MSPASTPPISGRQPIRINRPGGFTLVELLIVLLVVGLISGVLMTAFERVLDIRVRLAAFLDGVEAPVLVADWFRSTVGGLVADAGEGRFVGRPRRMTGLSVAPLEGTVGVPTQIVWEVVFDANAGRSYLRYSIGTEPPMTIASWPGESGGLRYCGPDLACHETWPPDRNAAQLPLLVRLDAVKGSDPWPILAAPRGDRASPQTNVEQTL